MTSQARVAIRTSAIKPVAVKNTFLQTDPLLANLAYRLKQRGVNYKETKISENIK